MARADTLGPFVRRLQQAGVERITIDRGVTIDEIDAASSRRSTTIDARDRRRRRAAFRRCPHIRVGRVTIEQRVEGSLTDMATIKRLYTDAVSVAGDVWDSAQTEGRPDATAARSMIDGLAQAVAQNRTALLALTTLKNYDNYTFTHMVNVSILTMGQARGLGIDGPLLREFGLAALMHDIGKVRTPLEILNKPDKLTDDEFDDHEAARRRRRRDPADDARHAGAGAGRRVRTPPAGRRHRAIPSGVTRASLNIGTMLCSIADVYDAMRSQRHYQQAFPTDRILAVLKRNDGTQFDQHLVRRFVQLIGIYPAGNLVRLNTGEMAVVLTVYAPDPYRPHVRVLIDRERPPPRPALRAQSVGDERRSARVRRRSSRRSTRADYPFDPLLLM